ncbi:MAG: phage antirepressor [Alphaproteobacteria bacterium]|nr:phage antirepressor [Alphaproteobacteria bacterium]
MNNSELKIFNYKNNEVRTTIKNGEIWWVLKDVCQILGITNHKDVILKLESDEKGVEKIDSLGGAQKTTIINESGLYKVILRSDKPEAKKFMNWITHEVLPSIRKHGAYITSAKMEELMNDPETWVKLIRTLQQERREKELLKNQVEKDKPKVIFCDAVSASDSDILVREMAKILRGNGIDIGEHRLFERLRNEGFLIRRKGTDKNIPTQRSMNLGLFKITETTITHSDGHVTIAKTSKITGKGQVYFTKYFLAHKKDNDNE